MAVARERGRAVVVDARVHHVAVHARVHVARLARPQRITVAELRLDVVGAAVAQRRHAYAAMLACARARVYVWGGGKAQ